MLQNFTSIKLIRKIKFVHTYVL